MLGPVVFLTRCLNFVFCLVVVSLYLVFNVWVDIHEHDVSDTTV